MVKVKFKDKSGHPVTIYCPFSIASYSQIKYKPVCPNTADLQQIQVETVVIIYAD